MLHVFAAALALSGPSVPVVEARIADVIADPLRYGGRTLRIRGQIDACYLSGCLICPEDMTAATRAEDGCLRIGFDDFRTEQDREDPDAAPFERSAWREVSAAFRFSVVTVEGVFDPTCMTGKAWPPEPPRPDPDDPGAVMIDEVVCTGRIDLHRAQVRTVHRRIPSNDGLSPRRFEGPLTLASPEVGASVEQAYRDYWLIFDPSPEWKPMTVLRPETATFDDLGREAWACVCRVDDCSGLWPRREVSVQARTVNDPYFCYLALEVAGVWRVFPE